MNEVIIYLLKVMAIHGLLYLFYQLVLRNTGRHTFNRIYLLLALIVSFFIPLLEIPLPEKVQSSEEIAVIMWLSEPTSGEEVFELVPVEQASSNSSWHLVPWVYAIVVFVLLVRSIFYLILLTRLKRHSEIVKKHWFKLFKISHDRPFSFFSNIFMPKKLFGSDEFDQILAHECEHVRQFHSIDRLLMDFVVSLFWFNPFIYLYRNALIEIHEYQADEVVLKKYKDPVGYQEILYSQLQSAQYSGLVSHFNFSMIKKRIVMMNRQRKMSGWLYVLTVPVTLIVVFAFSTKEAMKPINEVGEEIASILGPENGDAWPAMELKDSQQKDIPSISPIKSEDIVRMTSGFGMRMHPIEKVKKMHKGMDFSCNIGTQIIATASGTVSDVDDRPKGYGKIVTITHYGGFKTRYAQLSEFKVKEGDLVKKGEVIALSGNSGASTGPHLHYEVLKDGEQVDPMDYIKDYSFKSKLGMHHEQEKEHSNHEMVLTKQQQELVEQEKEKELAMREALLASREEELLKREAILKQVENEKELASLKKLREEETEHKLMMEKRKKVDQKRVELGRYEAINSISDENLEPLFVVDGEIVEEITGIEPADIESISVIKGKSAAASYGLKGEYGVVEIKTKNKEKDKVKSKGKNKSKNKLKNDQSAFRVLIDPGHGGKDPGASVNGVNEKEIALQVAKYVGTYFSDRDDIEIIYTRDGDDFVSLKDRAEASGGADLVISIHVSSEAEEKGNKINVFVDANNKFFQESLKVSEVIGSKFSEINRDTRLGVAKYYLMKSTECPTVLIELGQPVNDNSSYLTTNQGKQEIASALAFAIETSADMNW